MTHLLRKSWLKYLVQALAVAVVIAGTVFYISGQKSVTISIDGQNEEVSTRATTVAAVLEQQDITLDERDDISATPDSELVDAQLIDIKRNKSIEVTLDGTERVVHTTGMTVADLVNDLDLDKDSEISTNTNQDLSALSGGIEIITPKNVNLVVDKKKTEVSTTAQTVKELLADQKVFLDADDEVNVKIKKDTEKNVKTSTKIVADAQIEVIEVSVKTWEETREIDFDSTKQDDKTLEKGKTKVETKGEKGERALTLRQETRNGTKGEEEVLKAKVTKEPVAEVVNVGTKKEEKKESSSSSSSSSAKDTTTVSSTWNALAKCESGGNWSINTGNGYYGGLQFNLGTWKAYGGSGLPSNATKAEQVRIATKVQKAQGWGAWPSCTSKLGLR